MIYIKLRQQWRQWLAVQGLGSRGRKEEPSSSIQRGNFFLSLSLRLRSW